MVKNQIQNYLSSKNFCTTKIDLGFTNLFSLCILIKSLTGTPIFTANIPIGSRWIIVYSNNILLKISNVFIVSLLNKTVNYLSKSTKLPCSVSDTEYNSLSSRLIFLERVINWWHSTCSNIRLSIS